MNLMNKRSLAIIFMICALTISALGVTPAYASTLTVSNTNDSGAGSLRQALADAGSGDTITFDSSLSGGTIYLQSTLTISQDVTIDGSSLASKITISGDSDNDSTGDVRVFETTGHNSVTVALKSLIVTKGFTSGDGGGLLNDSITTITDSVFDSNTAASGGAIGTNGALTVIDSTFSGNSSTSSTGGGGAILNTYTMMITGSTFTGNTANPSGGSGGAIYNVANPGAIYNSTFSGNSAAGGGAIVTTQLLTITNSTISGNSAVLTGGLNIAGGTTNLVNTIIANNSASYGLSNDDCTNDATIGTNLNNLIEDGSCSPALTGDPVLGPLQNNGGPTQTMAFGAGSPAVNAGDNANCPATDQRGLARPQGSTCDIGAYEAQIYTLTVSSSGALDGQLVESSETSNKGGSKNSIVSILRLGDSAANKQYRDILSFDTTTLPEPIGITNVALNLKSAGIVGGGNPINIFKGLMVGIKKGEFGNPALELADFQAIADMNLGPFKPALAGGWYSLDLTAADAQINTSGNTQIRLRFKLDDNNNLLANYLKLYSGDADPANQPQLVIEYYVP